MVAATISWRGGGGALWRSGRGGGGIVHRPPPRPTPFLAPPPPPGTCCTRDTCPLVRPPAAAGPAASSTSTRWWEQGPEVWAAAPTTEAEFRAAVASGGPGRLVLVDFYATWCAGCAKVYPALLALAADPDLAGRVMYVKVCNDRLGALSRAEGAAALPAIGLYGPGGARLLSFQARPSRLHLLKANLERMLDGEGGPNPPPGKAWALDQDGVVGLVDAAAQAARAVENAAAVAAAAASTASLSDRLMAMAGGGGGGGNGNGRGAATPAPTSLADRLASVAGGGPPSPRTLSSPAPPRPPPSAAEVAFRAHPVYGPMYNPLADPIFDAEIAPRLERPGREHYLDYTGAALYLNSQVDAVAADLKSALYGNPHSANPSSSRSDAAIEGVRAQVLAWLGADPAEYQVVFTASATAAAKLVGEAFPWGAGSTYAYLRESHTSMLGVRGYAQAAGAQFRALTEEEVDGLVANGPAPAEEAADPATPTSYSLFEFPAEENFAGVKHDPARWVGPMQATSTPSNRVLVALDASAWVPTQPLDLGAPATAADFVFLSFYKVFGYPTGVGALLMRNEAAALLDRPYFGGGTVSLATAGGDFTQAKCRPADRFADGSPSFLDIAALRHGFAAFGRLGGAAAASTHVAALAHWGAEALGGLRHPNGAPMVILFGKHARPDWPAVQGGVLNFEALDARGEPLSYRAFETAASTAGLHLRCGSLCAPGAAYTATDVSEAEIRTLADSGDKEGCDDDVESILVERPAPAGTAGAMTWVRRPLGTIRASFGATSTFRDVEALVTFTAGWVREAGK